MSSLADQAQEHILKHQLRLEPIFPLTDARFRALCEKTRRELPQITHRLTELYRQIHALKSQIASGKHRYQGMMEDLERLVPANLIAATPHAQLPHILRYLKAVQIRAERAHNNPAKDADKADALIDYENWQTFVPKANHEVFHWLMEEFRVSLFAQELGTAQPVSVKRLEALM